MGDARPSAQPLSGGPPPCNLARPARRFAPQTPLMMAVACALGAILAAAFGLWSSFGAKVFFEFIRSGMPLCG
jgi:hypothetical protein